MSWTDDAACKGIPPFWVEAWEPELTTKQRDLLLHLHATTTKSVGLNQLEQALKEQL